MPDLRSRTFPNAVRVCMNLLSDLAPVRVVVPNDFRPPLIVATRTGGQPDAEGETDYPIVLISCYGETYPLAEDLAGRVQYKIENSPLTEVGGVLIDEADIYVGEQEIPDIYPDERRISTTYRFAWRRQFRPE
jgi:hypothetical protein